jgi:hypothetical protein
LDLSLLLFFNGTAIRLVVGSLIVLFYVFFFNLLSVCFSLFPHLGLNSTQSFGATGLPARFRVLWRVSPSQVWWFSSSFFGSISETQIFGPPPPFFFCWFDVLLVELRVLAVVARAQIPVILRELAETYPPPDTATVISEGMLE